MSTLLYLSGEPGVGKTTLMRELTARWAPVTVEADGEGPSRIVYMNRSGPQHRVAAVELGRHRDAFSGTDALPQTVIGLAEAYLARPPETPLLLAEGARLANRRFLSAAADSGWRVVLAHLWAPGFLVNARRAARAAELGKPPQNPSWVKGRRTAALRLAEDPGCAATVLSLSTAEPPDVLRKILTAAVPELS